MSKVIITQGGRGLSPRYTARDGDGNTASVELASGAQLEEKHEAAARALCKKMGWTGELIGGHLLQGGRTIGRVWVWVDSNAQRLEIR